MNQARQIGAFLSLILGAFIIALALTIFMVFSYSPTGQYYVNQTLLEPDLLPILTFTESNLKTGGESRFIFDRITFSYLDKQQQRIEKKNVPSFLYRNFYKRIQGEKSILAPKKEVLKLFEEGNIAQLTLWIRTESDASWNAESKVFQEVQFSPKGDYYRIQLRDQAADHKWAYYYQEDIWKETIQLFGEKE